MVAKLKTLNKGKVYMRECALQDDTWTIQIVAALISCLYQNFLKYTFNKYVFDLWKIPFWYIFFFEKYTICKQNTFDKLTFEKYMSEN